MAVLVFHPESGRAPRKRWPSVVRAALLCVACVAVALAWRAGHVRHQRAVVLEMDRHAAHVYYDHELRGASSPPGPAWMRRWLGQDFFAHVARVDLPRAPLRGDVLAAAAAFPRLRVLRVHAEGIDDAGLRSLAAATQLEELTLRSEVVTDAGLAQLVPLRHLRSLVIAAPHVTDSGLILLEEIPSLVVVRLISTGVTDRGVERLRQARPECDVRVEPWSVDL